MEFVKSRSWYQEVARINGVLRPEGPLLPAQAVRPGGAQWTRNDVLDRPGVNGPFRAECRVNCDPCQTAWAG